jgi:dTDP-4-amino-4,6-dideoxygalactose transaminase
MGKDFIVFGAPALGEEEIAEVVDSLRSGWLGTGPKVARFENEFAHYKGASESCVAAVNSGTAALHLSMVAADLKPGDEVIAPAMTFCATINAIIHAGLTPVLADVEPDTMNIDPVAIAARITKRTRAIVPVHFAGRPCDMEAIMAIADRHHLIVIEDCAHAIESECKGRKAGTFGRFGCFSFYVTKNVVTGEGGMVLAKEQKDIERIKVLALHGMSKDAWRRFGDAGFKHYQVMECGFKYNMMDLQAAIGIHQLARIEYNWRRRQTIWKCYQDAFGDLPVVRPTEPAPDMRHAYHLYTMMIDLGKTGIERDVFLEEMTARKIGVGVHYLSIPEHPYYREKFGWRPDDYPHAMQIGRQTVSLPLSAKLTGEEVARICSGVREILRSVRSRPSM